MNVLSEEKQSAFSPNEVLASLMEGNLRFVEGKQHQRDLIGQAKQSSTGQFSYGNCTSLYRFSFYT